MIKFSNLVVCLLVVLQIIAAKEYDIMSLVQVCSAEVGSKPADFQDVMQMNREMSMEGKCLIACVLKKAEIMGPNRVMSVEGSKELFGMFAHADMTDEILTEIIKKCIQIMEENECEYSFKTFICCDDEAAARGLNSNTG